MIRDFLIVVIVSASFIAVVNFFSAVDKQLLVQAYLLYLLPLVFGCVIACLLIRKPIELNAWDILLFIVPYLVWVGLVDFIGGPAKTLSNLAHEPIRLGVVVSLVFFATGLYFSKYSNSGKKRSLIVLCASSCIAVAIWGLTPTEDFQW